MEIKGYKAFGSGLTNKYGVPFEVGKVYSKASDNLKFGEQGHGYHLASKLGDTFRFFAPKIDNVYCEVVGLGQNIKVENFNSLHNVDLMYVVEKFKIVKVLSREDIFAYVCEKIDTDINEFQRCLALYPFTKEELKILKSLVAEKEKIWKQTYEEALEYQTGDVSKFKRNPKYLRRYKGF